MASIFINYRRNDSAGHAGRIHYELRTWFPDDELFRDVRSIDCGRRFPEELEIAVRNAKAVIVVIGPDWLEILNKRSTEEDVDFVRREISISLERYKDRDAEVFPLLVGGAEIPSLNALVGDLADDIGGLLEIQALKFHPDDDYLWDKQFERFRHLLSQVEGVPPPRAQQISGGGHLTLRQVNGNRDQALDERTLQAARRSFANVSKTLLNWPQETEGQWIERPELDHLYDLTTRHQSNGVALLGGPGEGKSALLSHLGARLSQEGKDLLAIKADLVPRNIATLRDLEDWIDSTVPATVALRQLAESGRVIVLIDQLDSLAELMDQHSERLAALLQLIDSLRDCDNLSVLVSCRDFEFRNDVRFNTLDAQEVQLTPLSWPQVEPLFAARSLDTSGWSDDVRNVLCTPQHFALFLKHLANGDGVPVFTTYQELLNRVISERIEQTHGARTVEAAELIASTMAEVEEMWLGRDRFAKQYAEELERLEESGFLVRSENGMSIAFRHQTLFEFLRARAFLRAQQSLAEFAIDRKQQSLYVRPILWNALSYLRESDIAAYRNQFESLWSRPELRRHIRFLLLDFLGKQANPDDREAGWLFSQLDDPQYRRRIFRATARSAGWFERLDSRLPEFMTADPEETWEVTPTLIGAVSFDAQRVLALIRAHWVADERYLPSAFAVLQNLETWDDQSADTMFRLADHAPSDTFPITNIAKKISEARPALACKLIARYLQARIVKIDRELETGTPEDLSEDSLVPHEQEPSVNRFKLSKYERLIDNHLDWHDIQEISSASPETFVEEMWPRLVELFTRLARQDVDYLVRYRGHFGLAFVWERSHEQPLQQAIESAVCQFAESNPAEFLKFVNQHKNADLAVLHFLMALGIEKIAGHHASEVLEYLLEDARRLTIGDKSNDYRYSQALIAATAPSLSADEVFRLESTILEWEPFRSIPAGEDAQARFVRQKSVRQRRLRLLRKIPIDRLSSVTKQRLIEEERALPDTDDNDRSFSGGLVKSPMSAEQMSRATDDQILVLFDELHDDTGWEHPSRRHTDYLGGSVQASREFAKFATNEPERALRLMSRFEPGATERPAGSALCALAKESSSAELLLSCIHELSNRGFASEEFRLDAARCLGELAPRLQGLDDETSTLLESWITEWRPDTNSQTRNGSDPSSQSRQEQTKSDETELRSLLWSAGGLRILPNGNYPALDALMRGYLCRRPKEIDSWLAVLERHVARKENLEVWCEIASSLGNLVDADRGRAVRFFESLFAAYPEILYDRVGVSLVARVQSWLPEQHRAEILETWITGDWEEGPQAAGEVLALYYVHNPDDEDARSQIERVMQGVGRDESVAEKLQLGAAYTFVAAWSEPALKALATPRLVELASVGSSTIDQALSGVIERVDTLPTDGHTRELLDAMLERPAILTNAGRYLLKSLKAFLRNGWEPILVFRIANAFVTEGEDELGDIRTRWAANAGDLADIALTLHRIPETKQQGLELFEHLMLADSYDLGQRIEAIDRPAFR